MKISQRYASLISNRRFAVFAVMLTALAGAFLSSIDNRLAMSGINLISLQFTFSGELFSSYVVRWSESTIQLFVQYLKMDIVFAFCYAVTLSSVLSAMWAHLSSLYEGSDFPKYSASIFRFSLALPSLAAAFNIGEDILLYSAARLGYVQSPVVPVQSSLAAAKYVCLIGAIAGIMTILFLRRRKMRG